MIDGRGTNKKNTHTDPTQSSLTHSSEKDVSLLLLVSLLQSPQIERERVKIIFSDERVKIIFSDKRVKIIFSDKREREREKKKLKFKVSL